MSQLEAKIQTDTWVPATWDEYLEAIAHPDYAYARGYYHQGFMRLEMTPLGNPHSRDHFFFTLALGLYASIKGIDLDGHDNCTYRKTGLAEAQPDLSFYMGKQADSIPWDTRIINLDRDPAPDLVIEIADASLADDKGEKRLLYEAMGIQEYWIADVQQVKILAFGIANRGSRQIDQSLVLPGLDLALLEEALRRSRQTNHGKVSTWLLAQFQGL